MEERKEVNEDLGGQLKRAGNMIDGLRGIIAHDERILRKGSSTVGTHLVQAAHSCSQAMFISDDEHERFLFLTSLSAPLHDRKRTAQKSIPALLSMMTCSVGWFFCK
jgi:hypothetical protein